MNNAIFYFFYNLAHQSILLDKVIVFFAVYFSYMVVILALGYFFFYRQSWREFFFVFFSVALAGALSKLFKFLIHTPRPIMVLPDIHTLFLKDSFAFPSDHAAVFAALGFSIFFLNRRAGYVFIIFALLIGLARIIAGVHFPIDILGGFILGTLTSYFVAYFLKSR